MVGTLILCTKLELGDYLGYLEPIMDISPQSCVKTTWRKMRKRKESWKIVPWSESARAAMGRARYEKMPNKWIPSEGDSSKGMERHIQWLPPEADQSDDKSVPYCDRCQGWDSLRRSLCNLKNKGMSISWHTNIHLIILFLVTVTQKQRINNEI